MTSVTALGSNGRTTSAAAEVEFEHGFDGGVEGALGRDAVTLRLEDDPRPETLRQEKHVVGPGARLRPDPFRVHRADDGEPVLRLGVADRVAAREDRAGLAHLLVGAGKHLAEHLDRELLGERGDGQREQRPPAHCEHVVQRIRRRDRSERARIVDERREEVDGEDDRALVVEAVDRSVVRGIESDEEVLGLGGDEAGEKRLEPSRRVLRRTPAGLRERRESNRLHAEHCTRKEIGRVARTRSTEKSIPFSSPPDTAAAAPSAAAFFDGGKRRFPRRPPFLSPCTGGPLLAYGRMNRPSAPDVCDRSAFRL